MATRAGVWSGEFDRLIGAANKRKQDAQGRVEYTTPDDGSSALRTVEACPSLVVCSHAVALARNTVQVRASLTPASQSHP